MRIYSFEIDSNGDLLVMDDTGSDVGKVNRPDDGFSWESDANGRVTNLPDGITSVLSDSDKTDLAVGEIAFEAQP